MASETSGTFFFELVSPERRLAELSVWQVSIPGDSGVFGVRAGHMALAASVQPGVVKIWETPESTPHDIFITGGFADVTPRTCSVLAEEAVMIEDLDPVVIAQALSDLEEDIAMAENDLERARLTKGLALERARLNAAYGK